MANDTEVSKDDAFADRIAAGVAAGIEAGRPRKITIGQFEARTPWNTKRTMGHLKIKWFQNDIRMNEKRMTKAEIDCLNQITRSGRYINRIVEVSIRENGAELEGNIRYKNKTFDDRMEFAQNVNTKDSLVPMLTQIINEQNAENEKEGNVREQRQSFNTKATQAARARVATDNE